MKITWLGQAGLLMENDKIKILIDPYLSDSVVKVNPRNYRRVPVDKAWFNLRPDMMIVTHDHLDHLDPETVPVYLERDGEPIDVLASAQAYGKLLAYKHGHNYMMMKPGTVWTRENVSVTAITAYHSEETAIGVIIDDGEHKYYVTGDTLYNEHIFSELPDDIYALFLPVNGVGNNMNVTDAERFAKRVGAKYVVPYHVGMFDEKTPEIFGGEGRVVPKIWQEIKFC